MKSESAERLLRAAGLRAGGHVLWGERVPWDRPGVYVLEAPTARTSAPLDASAISGWIERVPTLRVDGAMPTVKELAARLAEFWIPDEPIVYVGLAGTSVARRVGQFYRTPLGDPRPHAGGHWIKTLAVLGQLEVWWAATNDPDGAEAALLASFARRHPGALPFANRQHASGARKAHGITGSTLAREERVADAGRATAPRVRRPSSGAGIAQINAALQAYVAQQPNLEATAIEGARDLERKGLLRDSTSRPGLPLRKLLRAGRIDGAWQDGSRRWHIRWTDGR